MNNVLKLETTKYAIKLSNFEGPLDLLCYLIDKDKMEITDVSISSIADQYIEYIKNAKEEELEVASEFLIMATTLLLLKSKKLLPKANEEEDELSEEELLRRIIEYKKYKELSKIFTDLFMQNNKRFYKKPDTFELKSQKLETSYDKNILVNKYQEILDREQEKINVNAKNIEKIAITETITVASKVKDIFRELIKNSKFIFSKLFPEEKCSNTEIVTAFSGLLELSRRNKVVASQDKLFGDIVVTKKERKND